MSLKEEILSTEEGLLGWHQDRCIHATTDLICDIMRKDGISKKELADRLGRSKGFVSQLLDGSANMTLRTVSDVFTKLGYEFHPDYAPLNSKRRPMQFEQKRANVANRQASPEIQVAVILMDSGFIDANKSCRLSVSPTRKFGAGFVGS